MEISVGLNTPVCPPTSAHNNELLFYVSTWQFAVLLKRKRCIFVGMSNERDTEDFDVAEAHQYFAMDLYNLVWDLLDRPERDRVQDGLMVHAAHAAAFHWSQIGQPEHLQRSQWQLTRVYIMLGDKEQAMHYARRCFEITQEQRLGDFDLAFALEAMARANAQNGNRLEFDQYYVLAMKAADQITDENDKNLFLAELESGSWFGMR